MDVRMTPQISVNAAIRQAQLRQNEIANLQEQLSTGLRIRRPSDAPNDWGHLSTNKAAVERMDVELENMATARQRLNQSVGSLTDAGELLVRARELALGGAQSQHRETLALEVDRILDQMLTIANLTDAGLHLFSGTDSAHRAFEVTSESANGKPREIRYMGAAAHSEVSVSPGMTADLLPSGADVFMQADRSESVYIGVTGAAAGEGTDSGQGVGELLVRHTSTSYAAGNVSPGASSAAGDTIIGPAGAHILTIADDPVLGRVVRLNQGGPVPFDLASTDLEVAGPNGEKVYVDMSAVPAGFSGDIDITSNGTLSVDGGATEVAIDYSTSQIVTDSQTGDVTVVDSTNIRLAATDRVEYTGSLGVFDALMQLRDDLRAADQYSTPELLSIMDARIVDMERVHHQLMDVVGEQSVQLANLETLESRTRELRLVTQEAVIETENADIADVIVRLQTQQNHLQFIYAATAGMNQVSLLDFIS